MNYDEANGRLTGRCQARRKLANNTWLERRRDNIAVRLHNTDVVTFRPNGDVVLDTGGWRTVTTKDRINGYAPTSVWSDKGRWMVGTPPWRQDGGSVHAFADGMVIHADGTVTGALDLTEIERQNKHNRKVKRDVAAFLKALTPERIIHQWENPEGDCWFCRIVPEPDNDSCLASHVEEDYFHASLAFRAIAARGYRNPDFIMSLIYAEAKRGQVSSTLTQNLGKFLRKHLMEGVSTR